jgi:transcriptional regulator with XRE-family HTH domain
MAKQDTDALKQRNLEGYGLKIKKYRKRAGLSADDLAKALRVTVSSVRNWECGLSRPDPEYLYRMFFVLDVSPNEFFGISGVGASLSSRERDLVRLFRSLDARGKEDFRALGEALAGRIRLRRREEVRSRLVSVPDYGRFAAAGAGDGWSQQSEAEEVLLYDVGPVSAADEIIRVSGCSMEPAYHDRDRVLVAYCKEMELGGVYIFSLRGRGCVIKEAAANRLRSQNEEYEDIIPSEEEGAELIGRVLGVLDPSMLPSEEEIALYRESLESRKSPASVTD